MTEGMGVRFNDLGYRIDGFRKSFWCMAFDFEQLKFMTDSSHIIMSYLATNLARLNHGKHNDLIEITKDHFMSINISIMRSLMMILITFEDRH